MLFLISFYDNALIYYPNVFFVASFFISILGIISVSIGLIVLRKKIRKSIEKIKINLKYIERIKREERKKVSFFPMIRIFFERKRASIDCIMGLLTISFVHMIKVTFIRINTALGYIEAQAEKIVKKIEKEIFIKE